MRLTILFTLFLSSVSAQDIPLGSWRTHFSYDRTQLAESTLSQVFAAADVGLYSVDRASGEVVKYSTLDGLQGVDISALSYDPQLSVLLVGYRSGNLDMILPDGIRNLDLVSSSQVIGSKSVRDIEFSGNRAYVATDYGMLEIEIPGGEVRATYRELGQGAEQIAVRDVAFASDSVFLVTENGWQSAPLDGTDLADFRNWNYSAFTADLFQAGTTDQILYLLSTDTLFRYASGKLLAIREEGGYRGMFFGNTELYLFTNDRIERIGASGTSLGFIEDPLFSLLNDVEIDPEGGIWVADDRKGLLSNVQGVFQSYAPSGPVRSDMFSISSTDNGIAAFSGGWSPGGLSFGREAEWSVFADGIWMNDSPPAGEFSDIVDGLIREGQTFLASAGDGLLEITDGNIQQYDDSNSPLQAAGDGRVIIADILDRGEEVFLLNYASSTPLLSKEGETWRTYEGLPPITSFATGLELTGDVAWMRILPSRGGGLVAYDLESGNVRFLNEQPDQGSLASRTIFDLERDREGFLWIGTARGVSLLFNPLDLDGPINAIEPVFEGRPLLVDRNVYAIASDGGNRKWMGTDQGAWLFDALADNLILHFTATNSPLPSDVVLDIAVDDRSGEVFFLTDEGMASYRADATSAGREHSNVRIFPNPVMRTFQGDVGISGLSRNAIIKITDVKGRLIYQTRANGGTATWPVRSSAVSATGIYLVFSASEDGEETYIGKIAVIE